MEFQQLINELCQCEKWKQSIKERTMIYQVHQKEMLALKHRKSIDAYYDLSYEEWAKIRDRKEK